jgi:signal transduction histidine kinase
MPTDFILDPDLRAERKRESRRRLNTRQIPSLRAVGFVLLSLVLLAIRAATGRSIDWPAYLALVGSFAGYSGLSWLVLARWYGRTGRLDLGFAFLNLDVAFYLAALAYGSRDQPWIALFLLVRVADQVGTGFRRAAYFAHLITLAYLGYAAAMHHFTLRPTPWQIDLLVAVSLYVTGWYIALTSLTVEQLRRRTQAAAHQAGELLAEVTAQAAALEKARAAAETASRAKTEFLARMSHELRTPMVGVVSVADLLLDAGLTPSQEELARMVADHGAEMLQLIDRMLDFSSGTSGALTLERQPFTVGSLIEEILESVRHRAQRKGLELRTDLELDRGTRCVGDRGRLKQVLLLLVDNALKFTATGRVTLRVRETANPAEGRLRFEVADTGPGIDPSEHHSIFVPFHQVDGSSTRTHGGTGMGLALAARIVELMDGRIGVESRPGDGSTFWIELDLQAPIRTPA